MTAHRTRTELDGALDDLRAAPKDEGVLEMIVRRPAIGARDVLETGRLDLMEGLAGDTWSKRGSSRTTDGSPHPHMQLTVMSTRVIDLLTGDRTAWPIAGDQLYVDMDLSLENLPAGTRLAVGDAIIEVSAQPHTGCDKFVARFGLDAMKFVNSPLGRQLNLRGINAIVVKEGDIRVGDIVRKTS